MRTLRDFGEPTASEQALLANLDSGGYHQCGSGGLPAAGDSTRAIRASLLRFLLLGGADAPRLHEKGLRLSGAWVTGILDLEGCHALRSLALADCLFESPLVLQYAGIDRLFLDGSVLPGLAARRLQTKGGVNLRAAEINGTVDLRGAHLDGELVLDGATIMQPGGIALDASYISTRGDLTLRGSLFRGGVKVSGARLTGDLILAGTTLDRSGDMALAADGVQIVGDVVLRAAHIKGSSSFIGARVSGDFYVDSGTFDAPGANAFTLNRAVIDGAFFLRSGTKLYGALSLNGAYVGTIVDEPESWPQPGELLLNRFRYGGFVGSPVV